MPESANVYAVDALTTAVSDLNQLNGDVSESCGEQLAKAERLLEEVQCEERTSSQFLEAARVAETAAHTALIAAEASLAAAAAGLAAAIAETNPIAIAAAGEAVAEAENVVRLAKETYEIALQHRELMEKRYEMAQQCLRMTVEMTEVLKQKLYAGQMCLQGICTVGTGRLVAAHADLTNYIGRFSPAAVTDFMQWKSYKPAVNQPVKPDIIRERLNVSGERVQTTLAYLMATDEKFRDVIVRLRNRAENGEDPEQIERQIRKTVTGRVSEELVKTAFEPFGGSVSTQEIKVVDDGAYTKIDLVVKDLKVPVVLGRGEGMGALPGGSIAIEVKSGKKEYLLQQAAHLQFQAKGHQAYDASCTICTRDIKELPSEKVLREKMHDAGSPLLGMLPTKDELDAACIEYVLHG